MGAKSNKYQVCPYPSWISNERPVFASSFLVGHPKGARRQHWDELSFPPFFSSPSIYTPTNKNYTEWSSCCCCVNKSCLFSLKVESVILRSADGARGRWRGWCDVREKNARTQFTVQLKKGETSLEKVASPKIIRSLCSQCSANQFLRTDTFSGDKIPGGTKLFLENLFSQNLAAHSFSDFRLIFLPSQALNQFTQISESDILSWFLEISIPRQQRPIGECNFGGKWGEIN